MKTIKQFISKRIFAAHRYQGIDEIYLFHILGLFFDRRKWFYYTQDLADSKGDWSSLIWFLDFEIDASETNKFSKVPWYVRFSYVLNNWYLRKPIGYITIGWLLRSIYSA